MSHSQIINSPTPRLLGSGRLIRCAASYSSISTCSVLYAVCCYCLTQTNTQNVPLWPSVHKFSVWAGLSGTERPKHIMYATSVRKVVSDYSCSLIAYACALWPFSFSNVIQKLNLGTSVTCLCISVTYYMFYINVHSIYCISAPCVFLFLPLRADIWTTNEHCKDRFTDWDHIYV